jgi:hypothetical protein
MNESAAAASPGPWDKKAAKQWYKEERFRIKEKEREMKIQKKKEAKEAKEAKKHGKKGFVGASISGTTNVGRDMDHGFETRKVAPPPGAPVLSPRAPALPPGGLVPPPPPPRVGIEPGFKCQALWSEDGNWYQAVVDSISEQDGAKSYTVTFTEYGNQKMVSDDGLRNADGSPIDGGASSLAPHAQASPSMQQDAVGGDGSMVLTVEICEGRDLLPVELIATCEPYVVVTVFNSSGQAVGTRKSNIITGTLNPCWRERFEFHVTLRDKEGGYVEIALLDNRNGDHLGYIRQPLFRVTEASLEGWYFLDLARHHSAALYFRMFIHPYPAIPICGPTTNNLASGLAGAPWGVPMAATTAPLTMTGPTGAREAGASYLFIMRTPLWPLWPLHQSRIYEVRDAQGLLHYRLVLQHHDSVFTDPIGHEVGRIYLASGHAYNSTTKIMANGTTVELKRSHRKGRQPVYSIHSVNAPIIYAKGDLTGGEYNFYDEFNTIIADVSRGLAPGGHKGQYGIRVAPTFSNPLLILAAGIAINRSEIAVIDRRNADRY